MRTTNREALKALIVDNMNSDEGIKTRADLNTLMLVSIANSLAAIADALTERKDNAMEMTIDESMKVLQEVPKVMPITKESINLALDTMRKYQKITEIVEAWKADIDIDSYDCMVDIEKVLENGKID